MRLPATGYTDEAWRIHEIAAGFDIEDVWQLPVELTPETFPMAVNSLAQGNPSESPSRVYRFLFAVRWKLGRLFGWDREGGGLDGRVESLVDSLPADLRERPRPADVPSSPFTPLFLTENEYAAELANATCHGVLHLGLVREGSAYATRMTVLVRPNGRLGRLYMALIKPFRHTIIYPRLMQMFAESWSEFAPQGDGHTSS